MSVLVLWLSTSDLLLQRSAHLRFLKLLCFLSAIEGHGGSSALLTPVLQVLTLGALFSGHSVTYLPSSFFFC